MGEMVGERSAHGHGRFLSSGLQIEADGVQRDAAPVDFRVPFLQPPVAVAGGVEPFLHGAQGAGELFQGRGAVLVEQAVEPVSVRLRPGEGFRVEVDALGLSFGLAGEVVEFNADAAQAIQQGLAFRMDPGGSFEGAFGVVEPVQCPVFRGQDLVRLVERLLDFAGMGQGLQPRGQIPKSRIVKVEGVELLDLVGQVVGVGIGKVPLSFEGVPFPESVRPGAMGVPPSGGVVPRRWTESIHGIHQPLAGQEALPVLLAMQVDQEGSQLFQEVQFDRFVIDVGPGAAARGDASTQDDGGALIERSQLGTDRIGGGEFRLHDAFLFPSFHAFRPGAEHEAEGAEQDGFSASRLAGQHGPPLFHIPFDVVDERVVADGEAAEHQPSPWS